MALNNDETHYDNAKTTRYISGQLDFSVCVRLFCATTTRHGFFAINWNHPDPEIKRVFNEWLQRKRAERKKLGFGEFHRDSNRGGFGDKLSCLGALRILNHYRYKELGVDYVCKKLSVAAPYKFYPDLREAAKKAKKEISKLFPKNWSEAEWQRINEKELWTQYGSPVEAFKRITEKRRTGENP